MQLSPEICEQIVGHRAIVFEPSRTERRVDARAPLPIHTAILLVCGDRATGAPLPVRVREFSTRGISFLHDRPIPGCTHFAIRLPRRKAKPIWVLCSCVRCQAVPGGHFIVGARFERMLGVMRNETDAASAAKAA